MPQCQHEQVQHVCDEVCLVVSGLNTGRVGIMCEASRDGELHYSRYDTGESGDLDYVGWAGGYSCLSPSSCLLS